MLHARKIPGDGQLDSSAKLKGVQAFPQNRVKRLLLALKASLGRGTGAPLTFDEWGEMVGRPGNTLASWCADGEAHQIQALLASLERLPKPDRHRMVEDACRLYATLRHKRLAHDFVAVIYMKQMLRDPKVFNYVILTLYALNAVRWGIDRKIADVCYWLSAFAITTTVTFL